AGPQPGERRGEVLLGAVPSVHRRSSTCPGGGLAPRWGVPPHGTRRPPPATLRVSITAECRRPGTHVPEGRQGGSGRGGRAVRDPVARTPGRSSLISEPAD